MLDIKPLGVLDAPLCAKLHAACFSGTEVWSEQSFRELLTLPTSHAWGIDAEAALVAALLVQRVQDSADILTLMTRPDHRRTGLARILMQRAVDDLSAAGVAELTLDVAADNEAASRFYHRLGFSEQARRKAYYSRAGAAPVDALILRKSLAGHASPKQA